MDVGDAVELSGLRFVFEGAESIRGPNYQAHRGTVSVYSGDEKVEVMHPEKRQYFARGMVMTESAIDPGLTRDLYVALGEPLGDGAWAVRVYYKSFVRWLWLGGLLMTFGGILAASDKRYRLARKAQKSRAEDGEVLEPQWIPPGG